MNVLKPKLVCRTCSQGFEETVDGYNAAVTHAEENPGHDYELVYYLTPAEG